jgi:hypothetical protein
MTLQVACGNDKAARKRDKQKPKANSQQPTA